ncbi:MAG: hypothetical protein ACXWC8_15315, partial [Limisphaerales bacterium]
HPSSRGPLEREYVQYKVVASICRLTAKLSQVCAKPLQRSVQTFAHLHAKSRKVSRSLAHLRKASQGFANLRKASEARRDSLTQ